jgi:TonB family protein
LNSAPQLEIEKDLVRWPRAKWVTIIMLVLALETVFFLRVPHPVTPASGEPSTSPSVVFSERAANPELSEVQSPTLFASANVRGFSGLAWLIKKPWRAPAENGLPPAEFLIAEDAKPVQSSLNGALPAAENVLLHIRPPAQPDVFEHRGPPRDENSRLRVEGLDRQLSSVPSLPPQYATDALKPSVVQVLVQEDGSVFSARLLSSSGSKTADSAALNVARKTWFEPAKGQERDERIATGKLIFEWRAIDPAQAVGKSGPAR